MASVFLIGFMAAGKSAVGRELARVLDCPFTDLDEQIEQTAQRSIDAIFADSGEAAFRRLEREALERVIAGLTQQPAVVATGGGAAAQPGNLEAMLEAGLVVELSAPLPTLLARASATDGPVRPLLARGDEAVEALLAARQPLYRQAHACVDTSELGVAAVASRVAALVDTADALGDRLPRSVITSLPETRVPIVCESGLTDELGALVATFAPTSSRVAIVTDSNVGPLYLERVERALASAGHETTSIEIAAGEGSKTPAEHARVAAALIAAGLDRKSVIVALGGGVVGDLAGYVAATLYRGIRVVQVPTTLVAMTDSAIGGKTGVNVEAGKNLLGAFWQPSLVAIDPDLLETLPERERRAGCGELLKYGLLDGEALWRDVAAYAARPDDPSLDVASIIRRCAGYKSWIVGRDAREQTGERALLNLGHTVGHAIERAAGYGEVLHGEAVALGLIAMARISCALENAPTALETRVTEAIAAAGLDADLDPWLRADVLDHIGVDKKRTGRHLNFIVLRDLGAPLVRQIPIADIANFLLPSSQL